MCNEDTVSKSNELAAVTVMAPAADIAKRDPAGLCATVYEIVPEAPLVAVTVSTAALAPLFSSRDFVVGALPANVGAASEVKSNGSRIVFMQILILFTPNTFYINPLNIYNFR